MKTKRSGILSCIVIILMISFSLIFHTYNTFAQEARAIRVGFPIQPGLTMHDENGAYSGYTYDYLIEIAQYTGWTYEFVELEGPIDEQLTRMLQLLEAGELDILGAMNYSETLAQKYDFPSEHYGNAYYVIAVKDQEDRIDEYNLPDYKNLRVALLKQAKISNESFFQYARLNGIDYEVVWCENEEEMTRFITTGKADALVSRDVALSDGYRPIAKYSPAPFYFAVTKGNTDIVNELNLAITYLNDINPMLQTNLYNKYFSRASRQLILNSQEKAFIQEHPTLRVLVHDGFGPLQYYGENREVRGVARDILHEIAAQAGWTLEYVYTDSYDDFNQAIQQDKADLVLSVPYDYDIALRENLLLSLPYLETEMVLVARDGVNVSDLDGLRMAVYQGERKETAEPADVVEYDSIEDCLNAVERGDCDYTYANSYAAAFYQQKNHHTHTILYPQATGNSMKYCIGIPRKNDKLLSAILNKGINAVDPKKLEHYIYNNAHQDQRVTFQSFIRDNPMVFVGSVIFIASCLIAFIYSHYHGQMKLKKQMELENIRYRYLSDLLKEVTFSYDFKKNCLELSQEGMRIFDTRAETGQNAGNCNKSVENPAMEALLELLKQKMDIDTELLLMPSKGEPEWYRIVIKVVMDGSKPVSAIGRLQNIHQEKLERDQLVKKSRTDGLTGIYNNETMKRKITDMLAIKTEKLALLIVDLDDFKGVNDHYGHYTGDQVLVQTATALREVFGNCGIVGRLGGDEFIACMYYRDEAWMEQKCQEFFKNLETRIDDSRLPLSTVSIGISLSREGDDFTALYQRADVSLYTVKNNGKNNFKIES